MRPEDSDDVPTVPLQPQERPAQRPAPERIVKTVVFSLALSALLLVTIVLPAEYGRDPLGTGELLGIAALAGGGETLELDLDDGSAYHVVMERAPRQEILELHLEPFEEIEYKARMVEDATIVYRWATTGQEPLYVDCHGHPFNDLDGQEVRYQELDAASSATGAIRAPYGGMHGWYWRNDTGAPVDLLLELSGHFVEVEEMHRAFFDPPDRSKEGS